MSASPRSEIQRDSPYQGFEPYSEADAPFFFGRDQETRLIIASMFATPLTLLYGASGIGKTSVLRAGVVSQLLQRRENLMVVMFRAWQGDAIGGLENAIAEYAGRVGFGVPPSNAAWLAPSASFTEYLRGVCADWLDRRLMIILDQFEEYLNYHSQPDAFLAEFPKAVNCADLPVSFLLSIREDSLARLDRFKDRIPSLFDNLLRLERLDDHAAADAISEPVKAYNRYLRLERENRFRVEQALVVDVIEQVQTSAGVTGGVGRGQATTPSRVEIEAPYLQLVMSRLWEEEARSNSRILRQKTLSGLGGVKQITQRHLDEVMCNLPQDDQYTAARVFHFLVTPSGTKFPYAADDLADVSKVPKDRLAPVLEKLAASKIRVLRKVESLPNHPSDSRYEIFHDVLVSPVLEWRARVVDAQARAAAKKDLEQKQAEARKLLEQERAREVKRRQRLLLAVLSAFVIALVVLGTIAAYQTISASYQAKVAFSRELASNAFSQLPIDPELSLLLATKGLEVVDTAQAEDALRQSLLESRVRATMRGHTGALNSTTYSPGGKILVTASEDMTARVWDAATGKSVVELRGHTGRVTSAIFSRDGKSIATASEDRTARVWEVTVGKSIAELRGHTGMVTSATFSPDGKLIATASEDGTARIWETATGKSIVELRGHRGIVQDAIFSPDGRFVVTASEDGTARVWEATTGKSVAELRGHTSAVRDATFSPDGGFVVTASEDGTARVWESSTGKVMAELRGHTRAVRKGLFSPDGRFVVTASEDKTARLWVAATGISTAELRGHTGAVYNAVFSPDGKFIGTASEDGTAQVWDTTGKVVAELHGHTSTVRDVEFSPEGRFVATASEDGTARVWEVAKDRSAIEVRGHGGSVLSAAFTPGGYWVVMVGREDMGSEKRELPVWDVANHKSIAKLSEQMESVSSAAFSTGGKLIVTAGRDNVARVWDIVTRKTTDTQAVTGTLVVELRGHSEPVTGAAFNSDDKFVVTASRDGTARVWEVATGRSSVMLRGHTGTVHSAAFSPDGKFIITGGGDVTARVWEVATGNVLTVLRGHAGAVYAAAFSFDGTLLVTASADSTARVWEVATGRLVTELRGHAGEVYNAAFSSDGKFVVTASSDNTARVWEVATGKVIEMYENTSPVLNAVFGPGGKSVVTASTDGIARTFACEVCGSVEDLLTLARKRVTRDFTCEEWQQYLNEKIACPTPTPRPR